MAKKQTPWAVLVTLAGATSAVWIIIRQRRRPHAAQAGLPLSPAEAPSKAEDMPVVEQEPPPSPEGEAPPAPKPAAWRELEPADPADPVPHTVHRLMPGVDGWQLVGASRRGKMHAHNGSYREDAFAMDVTGRWHIIAVSDGAGSARLSRVGSRLIVETALAHMKQALTAEPRPSPERLHQALDEALQAAHAAVHQEAKRRELPVKEFSATFLLLIHGEVEGGHAIGSIQVGDGLIALKSQDGVIESLAERDSGTYGGETYFLTSRPAEHWLERGVVRRLEQPPKFLVAMSDGVADDFIPYETYLPGLFDELEKLVAPDGAQNKRVDQALLDLIGYDKRGSFDDRTLVMLYRKPAR